MGWEVSMSTSRRRFSREFKLEAVRLVTALRRRSWRISRATR
jgi:transposase-like protein